MKVVIWTLIVGLVPVMMACSWREPDVKRYNTCSKGALAPATGCAEWETYFTCEVRMPLFWNDTTASICKEEADCRQVCDKIRSGK